MSTGKQDELVVAISFSLGFGVKVVPSDDDGGCV